MPHSFQIQKDIGQIFHLISLAIINWVQKKFSIPQLENNETLFKCYINLKM